MVHAKNYEIDSTFVKVIPRKLLASFFRTRCIGTYVHTVDQSKTVAVRITQLSPQSGPMTLVSSRLTSP